MAYILCVETSGTNCSVSVSCDGEVLVLIEENTGGFSHAEKLHGFIKSAIEEAKITPDQLAAIAVSKGPGSYTGLRIGVSTVKGLCFAWEVPLISIPTLTSLAQQAKVETGYVVPMLDARRMEAYVAVYNANMEEVKPVSAEILTEDSFSAYLEKSTVTFLGDAVAKTKEIIQHPNAVFVENKFPSANEMAVLAYAKLQQNEFEDVAYFEPFYLKDFVTGKKS